MYVNKNKKQLKIKKLEKSGRVLNPGRDEKSSALLHPAIMFKIIILKRYHLSEWQSSDPLVSPGTKFLSYKGDYVSILIMEQAHGVSNIETTNKLQRYIGSYIGSYSCRKYAYHLHIEFYS